MQQTSASEVFQDLFVGDFILFSGTVPERVKRALRHPKAKEPIQRLRNAKDRNAQVDGFIQQVRHEVATIFAFWPESLRGTESFLTPRAPVVPKPILHNPPLYGSPAEKKVIEGARAKTSWQAWTSAKRTTGATGTNDHFVDGITVVQHDPLVFRTSRR